MAKPSKATVSNEPEVATDRNRVAAVDRAIDLLLAFHYGESSVSLAQLADRTGMYKSTVLRLLHTLEQRGFVSRLADRGYRLGAPVLRLGTIYQKSFRLEDAVMPQLTALTNATDESASFFVTDGKSRYCLFRVEPKQAVRHHVEVGESLPLGAGASGKVLRIFGTGADATPRDKFSLIPIISMGSNPLDISVIAGPVFGAGGQLVGAISVSGPTSRFDTKMRRNAGKSLVGVLKALTNQLGGDASIFDA
jgi:DNA-binding IclR family transcriptional regulator